MNTTNRLASMHARALCRAAERREAAARHRMTSDAARAEMAEDDAAIALAEANALREVLQERGAYVHENEGQLVLFQFGKEAA
jgi:hypothetical protein